MPRRLPLPQAVFGTYQVSELPDSLQQVDAKVLPEVLAPLGGTLGRPVAVKLPGKCPQHERVYLLHLMSQISGQYGTREPWMWLVWMVLRSDPSGLLPWRDVLVDMSGPDRSPINEAIRQSTLEVADSIILVTDKAPGAYPVSAASSRCTDAVYDPAFRLSPCLLISRLHVCWRWAEMHLTGMTSASSA